MYIDEQLMSGTGCQLIYMSFFIDLGILLMWRTKKGVDKCYCF